MPQPPPPSRRRPAHPQRAQKASVQHEDGGTDQPCLLERAHLHAVPRTLLTPLAARAHGGRYFAWLACQDAVATQLLAELGADINAYLDDLPTVLNVLWRTRAIKQVGQAFFAEHPQALGVNLGCGLTDHFQ